MSKCDINISVEIQSSSNVVGQRSLSIETANGKIIIYYQVVDYLSIPIYIIL
jgi:hypothetical protein